MRQADLDKVGNADLLSISKFNSTNQRLRSAEPQKIEISSPQPHLDVQSHIGFNIKNSFCGHTQQEHAQHGKCTRLVKTKWDKFSPYSFHRLSNQQKDSTFLQLYDDYRSTRANLNENIHKCTRITTKLRMLQSQLSKLKSTNTPITVHRNQLQKEKNQQIASLKQQIRRLHAKIIALTGSKFKPNSRPKTANKAQKQIFPVNENLRQQLQNQRKHVRQLLLIIDELKRNKFQVQEQLKIKQGNQSQISRPRNNKSKVMTGGSQSQFNQFANELHNWKQKYNDLQLVYHQMNSDKDKKIKELSEQLIFTKENQRMKERVERRGVVNQSQSARQQEIIKQLTMEKQKLQTQLRRVVQLPFYQNNNHIVQTRKQLTDIQMKYKLLKEQFAKVNQKSNNFFAQLQFKTKQNELLKNQNVKVKKQLKQFLEKEHTKVGVQKINEIDYDDYYRKMLHLVKLQGDDPVWRKFQLMAKPQIKLMTQQKVKSLAQQLWHSKLQLLGHLQKAQIELKTLRQGMDSRINLYMRDNQILQQQLKIAKARLDQWRSMDNINIRKPYQVYEQAGIKYDDSVSVFQTDQKQLKELESNENYFDLYLGQLNIDESVLMKNSQNKVKNISHFISFLTIDFYNHETQHSNFSEGTTKKLGNNYSFKVQVNTYFLKYISKNAISLQLWSPQGTATVLLGKGQIYLSQLINKAAQDISGVSRGKCQIYFNQKLLIATVEYRLRMRLPIYSMIEWAESKNQFKASDTRDPFIVGKRRILQIQIQKAEGIPAGMNAFVYFTVQQQDFFTQPERGPTPFWNYKQEVQVNIDQEFIDDLKQKYFQFTIFDDQKQVNEDVYGIAKANFTPLVDLTDNVDLMLDIQDRHGDKRGKLKIKAKWAMF